MNASTNTVQPVAHHAVDLDLLRTFVAIAETSSFSKAAERVFRTPSAVSMQVKKLEDSLQRTVLKRDSRSVSLTADGEVLLSYARRMLALSNEMMARFLVPDMAGVVTLGAPDDYGQRIMPEVLKRFAETHPNIRVDVVVESSELLVKRFDRGEMDVMVYTAQDDRPEPGATVLLEEDLVWAGVRGGSAHTVDPLPVSMWEDSCAWCRLATDALAAEKRSYRTAYKTSHTMAQRAAIEADLAIAPFPKSFMEDPLVVLGEEHGLPPLGKYQIRMRTKENHGKCTQAVADHVLSIFG
ncbi:MAG: LysR substrate-binding domain-containing protein [Pseudomonadota bacterium]